MNSLYALMIVTSLGITESPNSFDTMAECFVVSNELQMQNVVSYCVEKTPYVIQNELQK